MTSISKKNEPVTKVTQFQINEMKNKVNEAAGIKKKIVEESIDENINRTDIWHINARNIDQALESFSANDKPNMNVSTRLKASYLGFEEKRLAELKKENPRLKLSQLKEIVWKEFQKSSSNPLNQVHI